MESENTKETDSKEDLDQDELNTLKDNKVQIGDNKRFVSGP